MRLVGSGGLWNEAGESRGQQGRVNEAGTSVFSWAMLLLLLGFCPPPPRAAELLHTRAEAGFQLLGPETISGVEEVKYQALAAGSGDIWVVGLLPWLRLPPVGGRRWRTGSGNPSIC